MDYKYVSRPAQTACETSQYPYIPHHRLPSKNTYNEVGAHPLMTAFKHYNPDRPLIFKRRMFLLERHVALAQHLRPMRRRKHLM